MVRTDSPAVEVAREHVRAWTNHELGKARAALAPDVHVTVTTTRPVMPSTDTVGVDAYMVGLEAFAQAVIPGSLRELASIGDDRNALLLLTVEAAFGPGSPPVTLPGARLYRLDDDNRIEVEQVVFFVPD